MSILDVWMNGRHVGAWQQVRGGRDRFRYDKDWIADPQGRALSLSLPMTSDAAITSAAVGYYFDNLLPDGREFEIDFGHGSGRAPRAPSTCSRPSVATASALSSCSRKARSQRSTWPVVGKRADQLDVHDLNLAMAVRGQDAHSRVLEIEPRHFQALADRYPGAKAWPAMIELASRVDGAVQAVEKRLPEGFAETVWALTSKGMIKQAKSFLSYSKL